MRYKFLLLALFASGLIPQSAVAQSRRIVPHFANGQFSGGSFRTTFVVVNNTDSTTAVVLGLTGDNGDPLAVTITGLGTQSNFTLTLAPGAARILETDGSGSLVCGSAMVTSTANIGVSAILSVFDPAGHLVAESGIDDSSLLRDFVIPVDTTGTYNTGVALFSPQGGTATLTLLDSAGQVTGSNSLNLSDNAHISQFITDLFPSATDFRGTLAVRSSVEIAAMSLRQNQTARTLSYTTLPVVARSSTQQTFHLAQIANGVFDGGQFRTSIMLCNTSTEQATATVSFTQDDGSPLVVTIPGQGTNSTFDLQIPAGGTASLQTDGSGMLKAGAATIESNLPVGLSAILAVFDQQGDSVSETGVANSHAMSQLTFPVDETGTFSTGIALYNVSNSTLTLTLRLLDTEGTVVATSQQTLSPKGHTARFASSLFPGTGNFRGSIAVTSTGDLAATVLRQNMASGMPTYTTLPVIAGVSQGTATKSSTTLLTSTTVTGVAATSDATLNQTLATRSGFKLEGTVGGAFNDWATVSAQSGESVFTCEVDYQTRKYLIVLPAGSYTVTVNYNIPNSFPWLMAEVSATVDAGSVELSGDIAKDIALPAVKLFNVSGTVAGLDALPVSSGQIFFHSTDTTLDGIFPLEAGGVWKAELPLGTFSAGISAGTDLYPIGSLTVTGESAIANFTVPETALISGRVTPLTGAPPLTGGPFGTVVTATDISIPSLPWGAGGMSGASGGTYQIVVANNRTYRIHASAIQPYGVPPGSTNWLGFSPPGGDLLNVTGDTTFDLVIPTLPGLVTLSGVVTDPSGRPAASAWVEALSDTITGAPGVTFLGKGRADGSGSYSLPILSGTNYRVTFGPPE